jgi:hypothetical protein
MNHPLVLKSAIRLEFDISGCLNGLRKLKRFSIPGKIIALQNAPSPERYVAGSSPVYTLEDH